MNVTSYNPSNDDEIEKHPCDDCGAPSKVLQKVTSNSETISMFYRCDACHSKYREKCLIEILDKAKAMQLQEGVSEELEKIIFETETLLKKLNK